MAFSRPNGQGGFSWKSHLKYLQDKHPEDIKAIANAKLHILARENPSQSDYYSSLAEELELKIYAEEENKEKCSLEEEGIEASLTYDEEQVIVRNFFAENDITSILEQKDPPTDPELHWCSSCEDFTLHTLMEGDLGYKCTKCPQASRSSAESYIDTAFRTLGKLLYSFR